MTSPPKLLDRVRDAIRTRHYSRRTEEAYAYWIRRYIVFHKKTHPASMGAPEISAFLTWLAVQQHVSASTQNQALSALLFLYKQVLRIELGRIEEVPRAQVPIRVPVVLSRDEVKRVMEHLTGTMWIIGMLLYGAGLCPRAAPPVLPRGRCLRPRMGLPLTRGTPLMFPIVSLCRRYVQT